MAHIFKESTLINEWLRAKHPDALQWTRVRVGPFHNSKNDKTFGITRRWADAIFIEDEVVHIVEAKLKPNPGAIGQLELYEKLFRNTPEFTQYKENDIKLIFLTMSMDAAVLELTSEKGILYEIFTEKSIV